MTPQSSGIQYLRKACDRRRHTSGVVGWIIFLLLLVLIATVVSGCRAAPDQPCPYRPMPKPIPDPIALPPDA